MRNIYMYTRTRKIDYRVKLSGKRERIYSLTWIYLQFFYEHIMG